MMLRLNKIWIVPAAAAVLFVACHKKKPGPGTPKAEPTKLEVIPGKYKVYDTLGNYLYDMSISHWYDFTQEGYRRDTFQFNNFDGQFTIKADQSAVSPSNWPEYSFYLGHHAPILDTNNDRWQLFEGGSYYSNDSVYLDYELENIQYYIQDARPYESRHEKRIGIKQP